MYSGVDDHVLRKLDANLTIDPSQIAGGAIMPISNIQISFSVEIDGLNEPQTISAPANAKPISSLLGDLGVSPGVLGGALGGTAFPAGPAAPAAPAGPVARAAPATAPPTCSACSRRARRATSTPARASSSGTAQIGKPAPRRRSRGPGAPDPFSRLPKMTGAGNGRG